MYCSFIYFLNTAYNIVELYCPITGRDWKIGKSTRPSTG